MLKMRPHICSLLARTQKGKLHQVSDGVAWSTAYTLTEDSNVAASSRDIRPQEFSEFLRADMTKEYSGTWGAATAFPQKKSVAYHLYRT